MNAVVGDHRRVQLSPVDARMLRFGLRILSVFPTPLSENSHYDVLKLQHSFCQLLHEDFPFLLDCEHVRDETRGKPRRCTRTKTQELIEAARTSETLKEVLQHTPIDFIPTRSSCQLFTVKCSLLVDGSLVIGVNADHCVLDAEGVAHLMKRWGQHYLGIASSTPVCFSHDRGELVSITSAASTMPHPEYRCFCHTSTQNPQPAAPRVFHLATSQQRFHLSPAALKSLKAFAACGDESPPFSTLDCVTALLTWLISVSRGHRNDVQVFTAVNIRRRLQPPLPDNFTGNTVLPALSSHSALDFQTDHASPSASTLHSLARRIRQSISKFHDAYIRDTISLLAAHPDPTNLQPAICFSSGPDVFFSSWRAIGLSDVDFGSKPSYVGPPTLASCDGVVVFLEPVDHEPGLDALAFLEDGAMHELEKLWATRPTCCS